MSIVQDISNSLEKSLEGSLSHGEKNIWIALILGLIIPGCGHIYIWEIQKGVKLLLIAIALWILSVVFAISVILAPLAILCSLGSLVLALYSAYDAWVMAKAYNERGGFTAIETEAE